MLSEKVQHIRKRFGISQQKLASMSGLTVTTIASIEQGVAKQPTIQTMTKIADALNVSLDELVGRNFKPPKK